MASRSRTSRAQEFVDELFPEDHRGGDQPGEHRVGLEQVAQSAGDKIAIVRIGRVVAIDEVEQAPNPADASRQRPAQPRRHCPVLLLRLLPCRAAAPVIWKCGNARSCSAALEASVDQHHRDAHQRGKAPMAMLLAQNIALEALSQLRSATERQDLLVGDAVISGPTRQVLRHLPAQPAQFRAMPRCPAPRLRACCRCKRRRRARIHRPRWLAAPSRAESSSTVRAGAPCRPGTPICRAPTQKNGEQQADRSADTPERPPCRGRPRLAWARCVGTSILDRMPPAATACSRQYSNRLSISATRQVTIDDYRGASSFAPLAPCSGARSTVRNGSSIMRFSLLRCRALSQLVPPSRTAAMAIQQDSRAPSSSATDAPSSKRRRRCRDHGGALNCGRSPLPARSDRGRVDPQQRRLLAQASFQVLNTRSGGGVHRRCRSRAETATRVHACALLRRFWTTRRIARVSSPVLYCLTGRHAAERYALSRIDISTQLTIAAGLK